MSKVFCKILGSSRIVFFLIFQIFYLVLFYAGPGSEPVITTWAPKAKPIDENLTTIASFLTQKVSTLAYLFCRLVSSTNSITRHCHRSSSPIEALNIVLHLDALKLIGMTLYYLMNGF